MGWGNVTSLIKFKLLFLHNEDRLSLHKVKIVVRLAYLGGNSLEFLSKTTEGV